MELAKVLDIGEAGLGVSRLGRTQAKTTITFSPTSGGNFSRGILHPFMIYSSGVSNVAPLNRARGRGGNNCFLSVEVRMKKTGNGNKHRQV